MKIFSLVLLLGLALNEASANPPPPPGVTPPRDTLVFIPSGGGIKGTARMFRLTLTPDSCDKGYRVQLIKAPGIAQNYSLNWKEIHRGDCPETLNSSLQYSRTKMYRLDDGSFLYEALQGTSEVSLSDWSKLKGDTLPKWVAEIDGELYLALEVDLSERPAD